MLPCCGAGKNEIFLNLGGSGCTLLNQQQGYAAYNVLLNTGAILRIKDTAQIYRNLTFGNGGGTLDMCGCKMDWHLSGDASRDGFTIQALTEETCITNSSGQATLAVEQISLVLESPHPGQFSRGKFQGVKEIRHPKGKFMMLKPGHSMLVVNASLASDTLELSCRKLVVDFHLKLKKPLRGLVQVRLGEKFRFLNPREMRIEANYARRTLRGFYIPETPDSVYFYM